MEKVFTKEFLATVSPLLNDLMARDGIGLSDEEIEIQNKYFLGEITKEDYINWVLASIGERDSESESYREMKELLNDIF